MPTTFRAAFTHYLDVFRPPKMDLIKAMLNFATADADCTLLKKLISPDNRDFYYQYIHVEHRTLLDLLEECPSVQMPVELILELVPRLKYRYYSISSSQRVHQDRVHITVAVLNYRTPSGKHVRGTASSYLERATRVFMDTQTGSPTVGASSNESIAPRVQIFLRRSSFHLPKKPLDAPLLMIGPGTGLAPFRGFVQELDWLRSKPLDKEKDEHPRVLYFGCRLPGKDFLYQEELESYRQKGTLSSLMVAYSRAQPHKVYVQHLMKRPEDSEAICQLLSGSNGVVYICGYDVRLFALRSV